MQNAKDTFYEALRERLAAINPDRTISLRGLSRPGVLVEENELETAVAIPDCFRLQWSEVGVECAGALPRVTLQCSIAYETAGTALNAGMDRGRLLAAMDAELRTAIEQHPAFCMKKDYSALATGGPVVTMVTNVWWGAVSFGKTMVTADRIGRVATLNVMNYQEAGEL